LKKVTALFERRLRGSLSGISIGREASLTYDAFSLSRKKLQREYFERFEGICDEVKNAAPPLIFISK
jgi:hypothetical protein